MMKLYATICGLKHGFRSIAFSGKKRIQKSSAQKIVTNRAGMRLGEMKAMEIFPVDLASAQKQSVWEDVEGITA